MRHAIHAVVIASLAAACSDSSRIARIDTAGAAVDSAVSAKAPFRVPQESEIGDSVTLASVRRGRALIHSTPDSLPNRVRASLTCTNCHIGDGTVRDAMPLVGSYARFPQYRGRSGKVDILEDRINDCFKRSMNGVALDPAGRDMRDIVSYLAFLSRGFPVGVEMEGQSVPQIAALKGDTTRGAEVFKSRCIACHGIDGQGSAAAPPLWGPRSFNIGAGMSRVNNAARFIHKLMPRDNPGSLTPQQAYDVAAYVTSRPRPDFAGKENDWPKGSPPPDVAYETKASSRK
jgi:thiosulfate dehydrogenase